MDVSPPTFSKGAVPLRPRSDRIRAAAAATIGNEFHYYDFFLYATAAALVFNTQFFPTENPAMGTMAAFAGYAVGFVSRPIGGVVFGHVGDRFGRKVTLTWTLALMGVATFLIGLLPTYAQAGPMAPILLVALRMLQGFAAGGEWGGGILMATENAPPNRRGLYGAWSQAGVGFGFVISAGAFYLVRQLDPAAFLAWGWRIPFLASVVVVAAGLVIRANVRESAEFEEAVAVDRHRRPVRDVLREHRFALIVAAGVLLAEISGPLISTTFALAYGQLVGVDSDLLLIGVVVSMVVDTLLMLAFGRLSDSIGRVPVYAFGIISIAVFMYPFFLMIGSGSTATLITGFVIINGICHAAMVGTQPALLTELFPASIRSSGLALAQSIAAVLIGFLPFLASLLFYQTGTVLSVVALMALICTLSLVSLIAARRAAFHSSTGE